MTRLQQLLSGLFVLQLVLVAFVFWPRTAAGESGPLLPEFTADDVTGILIEDGTSGDQVSLILVDNEWVLDNGSGYPANGSKISELLTKLEEMQSNRLVAQTATSHRRLQVAEDDFVRRLVLTTADGETTLYIGRAPTAQATHVRLENQDETYLINNIANWEINAAITSWIDTVYTSLDRDSVTSLTLENANGTFEFEKEGDTWTYAGLPEGETFNQTPFNGILSRIVNLTLAEPLGTEERPEYGLDEPAAVLTVTVTNDGEEGEGESEETTYTLTVGAEDEESETTVVKWSGSPYYVRVSSFNVQSMIENTAEEFIQAAAEATPTPTPQADEADE